LKVAIMQPYLLPYIGYFQLVGAVDVFVVYDNIKYTKKGWINRNRLLENGTDALFSLPLRSGSDALDVRERELSADFRPDQLLARFAGAYRRAPYFADTLPLLESVLQHPGRNLFGFLHHALLATCRHLGLATEIRVSSSIPIHHGLRAQDKVLALCEALGASSYLNPIGGVELYAKEAFGARGVELQFLRARALEYPQLGNAFVPWLSIVDVLMFNSPAQVGAWVRSHYDLV
jgi:hypothetical protein